MEFWTDRVNIEEVRITQSRRRRGISCIQ